MKRNSDFYTFKHALLRPRYSQDIACSIIGHVLFGCPRMKCAGHGICKIIEVEQDILPMTNWSTCRTIAQVNKSKEGNYFIQVLKSTITDCLYKRQFDQPYFKVDSDFDMRPIFQSIQPSIIKKGNYIFWQDQDFIYIDFSGQINQHQ